MLIDSRSESNSHSPTNENSSAVYSPLMEPPNGATSLSPDISASSPSASAPADPASLAGIYKEEINESRTPFTPAAQAPKRLPIDATTEIEGEEPPSKRRKLGRDSLSAMRRVPGGS